VKAHFRASFAKDLRSIKSREILSRIKEVIGQVEKAQSHQEITSIKKLKGGRNYYRIRVGEYRIGLVIEGEEISFVRCLDRKEIYRYFP
jgi:mRNA interferase RelE/StbE